jgi:hypothetical protein
VRAPRVVKKEDVYYLGGPSVAGKPILRKSLEQAGFKTGNQNDH